MIPPLRIICPDDKGIAEHVSLKEFPCVPGKGDRIWISGLEFEVTGREFWTNNGVIDGSIDAPAVILKKV
ncbi:MAG: hypothetical protein HY674_07575 [Chloroflexi bacterium]|nr:hypothetical protein [Chloroflexota bacterium]